ncbi:MAG: hypothetical protein ABI222_14645, partial [Opitutaceae bacterium]
MQARTMDRVFLGVALFVTLASWIWVGWRTPDAGSARRYSKELMKPVNYEIPSAEIDAGNTLIPQWSPPGAQKRGPEWIYDVFTPPEINYDESTRQFAVAGPHEATRPVVESAGFELIAVNREPFRLQLIGYVGGEGHFKGAFENRSTREVFLAGPGRAIPMLGLVIT